MEPASLNFVPPADLAAARQRYLAGQGAPATVRPVVLEAWERSTRYGVHPTTPRLQLPDAAQLHAAIARSALLLERASPVLAHMHATLAAEPHVIALADDDGFILALEASDFGHPVDLARANIFRGASWHERDIGSNGVGTCLATGEPVVLLGPEHYQEAYVDWTCIGVPIRDARGRVVGALDLSVPQQHTHVHTWGWALSAAREIETALARSARSRAPDVEQVLPGVRSPLQSIRGLLRFLGTQLNLTPTHAQYLGDAEEEIEAAHQELQGAIRRVLESEEQARRELKEIEALYATAPVGLCVLDRELRFRRINPRLAELNGIAAEDHIGRTVQELLPGLAAAVDPILRRVMESGEPLLGFELSGETPAQPGELRHWVEHYVPLRDDQGSIFGVNVVVEEVTEQKRAAAEIERLYAEAQRAIAQRDQVLAVVSHDLRNPLNTIGMAAELLLQPLSDERRQVQAGIIRQCVQQASRLIEDLLDVARIEAGGFGVLPEPHDAARLVHAAVELHSPLAYASGIRLEAQTLSHRTVPIDRDRILQALGNLIGNAVQHTAEGGTVLVGVSDDGDHVRFMVSDTGAGIPQEHLPHIFDRFWQAARSRRAGAGLGLAIARGIAEAHGGRIWAESEVGRGTTFYLTVPA